jgi:hypothetical protein
MKAISLWQPWASLIAAGAKPFETRHWAPPRKLIGATIAIHAAKKIDKDAIDLAERVAYGQHSAGGFALADKLEELDRETPDEMFGIFGQATFPIGCVVCTARLEAAFQLGEAVAGATIPAARIVRRITSRPAQMTEAEVRIDDFGDYSPGRWAWLLTSITPFVPPPPAVGHQGFFDLPQGWLMCPE